MTDTLDAETYETIVTQFDLQNDVETQSVVYDDGRLVEIIKEAGVRSIKIEIDGSEDGSLFDYAARATIYDETGTIEQLRSQQDNGDQFIFNYADGTKTQRIDFDGDGSETWTFKVTDYNADSAPVVTFYDDFGDAPSDIIDDFGFGFIL